MAGEENSQKAIQGARGAAAKRAYTETEFQSAPSRQKTETRGGGGKGRVIAQYHDRVEHYTSVTLDDLKEAVALGVLQQAMIQSGTFFFSGAFWLLIELVARQAEGGGPFKVTPWMAMCGLSILFGGALAGFGWALFVMKQKKLTKYFPAEGS